MKKKLSILILFIIFSLIPNSIARKTLAIDSEPSLYPAYVQENGAKKWGLIDKYGKFVLEPSYEMIDNFWESGLAKVAISRADQMYYYGLINRKGEVVVEPAYINIQEPTDGFFVLNDFKSNFQVFDDKGNKLFTTDKNIYRFKDGMAKFYTNTNNDWLYGYLNDKGEEVIPAQYKSGEDFKNGMALVTTKDNRKLVIDRDGQTIYTLDFEGAANLSEGIFTYHEKIPIQNRILDKIGYAYLNGDIIADPQFEIAYPFENGFAVAATGYTFSDGDGHVGLINIKGEFVIPPEYSDIQQKGKGYFAVGKGGYSVSSAAFSRKALFSSDGQQLTDFIYYTIGDLKDGYFPVCDGERVFFIDTNGEEVENYPKAQGIGVFLDMGELIQGKFDNEIIYYKKDGKIAWKPTETWKLKTGQGIEVYEKKFRPDINNLIYYPEIRNHPDSSIQDKLNKELKDIFIGNSSVILGKDKKALASFSVNFNVQQNKDLLIFNYSSYNFPYGAAHGMPGKEYYIYNINNGNTYKLGDLFRKDSAYLERLSGIIKEKIQQKKTDKNSMILINGYEGFKNDPKFIITRDALQIYFYPYEIAAYAAGFPTFEIPYSELGDILDFDGEFWNAFDKNYQIVPQSSVDGMVKAEKD